MTPHCHTCIHASASAWSFHMDCQSCFSSRTPLRFPMILSSVFMINFSCFFSSSPFFKFNFAIIGARNQNRDIKTEGDAYISNQGIKVTHMRFDQTWPEKLVVQQIVNALHLWDNVTGQLDDLSTNFTFVIDSNHATGYGDGLAFFLAHKRSVITASGAIGLPVNPSTIIVTVAVEFGTSWNSSWDSRNSRNSCAKAEKWWCNITYGRENEGRISYVFLLQKLLISTGFENNTTIRGIGYFWLDGLNRSILPEKKNNVISWSFNSCDLRRMAAPA